MVAGEAVLFQCTECGRVSVSLGWLHAHIERHRGYTRFGIQLPFTRTSPGDFDRLMGYTRVLRVDDVTEVDLEDVDDPEQVEYGVGYS